MDLKNVSPKIKYLLYHILQLLLLSWNLASSGYLLAFNPIFLFKKI